MSFCVDSYPIKAGIKYDKCGVTMKYNLRYNEQQWECFKTVCPCTMHADKPWRYCEI